jgi:hypothetical protein
MVIAADSRSFIETPLVVVSNHREGSNRGISLG